MSLNSSILGNIVSHIEENYDIRLEYVRHEGSDIKATLNGVDVVVTVSFIIDEITGECVNIELYSDDIPELDDVTLDKDDGSCDDIYDELNEAQGRDSDFAHYMNNEEDDDEDRGSSL